MNVLNLEQGTPEWLAARAGKVTASRMNDLLATIKSGEAAARRDYKSQIVAEILTGAPQENGFINDEMKWGTEQEPFARAAYEVKAGCMVDQVGFVIHPSIERAGASPDGLVGENLLEIKCPKTSTHIGYLLGGVVPSKYENQMMWQMACCGAAWNDFVSFDPRLPEHLQLFTARLERDDKEIERLEAEVRKFLAEVDAIVSKLSAL